MCASARHRLPQWPREAQPPWLRARALPPPALYISSIIGPGLAGHASSTMAFERDSYIAPRACFTIPVHSKPCTPRSLHKVAVGGPSVNLKLKISAAMRSLKFW